MPAPGKKPEPKSVHKQRGTVQPCRSASVDIIETLSPALSLTPPKLPDAVAEVWADYVALAVTHGARQCDAESFAEWCTMAANLRKAREADASAPASYVAQFRMLGELFGLAGPKSRVVQRAGGAEDGRPKNPFERNGARGRGG